MRRGKREVQYPPRRGEGGLYCTSLLLSLLSLSPPPSHLTPHLPGYLHFMVPPPLFLPAAEPTLMYSVRSTLHSIPDILAARPVQLLRILAILAEYSVLPYFTYVWYKALSRLPYVAPLHVSPFRTINQLWGIKSWFLGAPVGCLFA